MNLLSIEIKNFKGLKYALFQPGKFSCLVGENNAGKSSVLQAIVAAVNRQASLNISLFYDPIQPIEFIWKFSNITEADLLRLSEDHRGRISPLVEEGCIAFCSRYKPDDGKLELKVVAKVPRDIKFRKTSIDEALKGKKGAAVRQVVVDLFEGRGVDIPPVSTIGAAKEFISSQIATFHATDMQMDEVSLPTGISSSLGSFLPEPIYIPAVKNLGDDLKTTQSTSFGKLLSLLLTDLTPDLERFERSFDELKKLLNKSTDGQGTDSRHEKIKILEEQIEKNLSANFPKLKVDLEIPPPELKTVLSSAQLYVNDGSRDLIENKGDGVKRSLTFAILKTYVDEIEKRNNAESDGQISRPILLLFEEPELYLHPKSQRILFQALSKISDDQQVIVTTHSPLFFAPNVTASFVRVAKEKADPKPVGKLYHINFNLNLDHASTFKLARFENADAAFFSRKVVLFEGDSDEFFIKHVAKLINDSWSFDHSNIALIPVNGKGNFKKYRDFFQAFNIEVLIVADLDVMFDGFELLGASESTIKIKSDCIQKLDRFIEKNPQLIGELSSKQITKRVKSPTWKERYFNLKSQIYAMADGATITSELKSEMAALFAWETVHHRMDAVQSSEEALAYLEPIRQQLYTENIFVLRKGAIEEYYPTTIESNLAKPQRALRAVELLETRALLSPLTTYRKNEADVCEFEEFLTRVFVEQEQ